MDVASVTLNEVLRAARARSAALVPETSGYLALAIGDASARLPYRIEDELVTLTTEGTVRVARGKEGVSPEEGARVLRDHLHRLLSVSGGSMPGLAHAGAPRREVGGPDTVVAEIESALIPCNRAAARRSLARLARDTVRARDAGRLAPHAPPVARGAQSLAPEARPAQRPPPVQQSAPPAHAQHAVHHAQLHQHVHHPQQVQQVYAQPTYAAQPEEYPAYAQPSAAYAPMQAYAQPVHAAYLPAVAAYVPAPQPAYAAPVAEAYAPAVAPPPADAAPYPHAPSYAEIAVAAPVFEVDVEIDEPALDSLGTPTPGCFDAPMAAEDMTHRLDVSVLGFEPSDATTIDSIEVIEASFLRIEAAMAQDADATPRLGTGWPTNAPAAQAPRPPAAESALGDHIAELLASPAPAAVVLAPRVDEAARSLEAALDAGKLATPRPRKAEPPLRMRRLPWQADLGRARKSDVSDLLARFGASDPQRDAVAMRRDIKRTIGIDATQLPPRVAPRDG